MKLPLSWLKDYIDVSVSPEKLAELLTMSGTAVERIERKGRDAVLEIEVTTNRPDCLSILGLAREVSALTGKKTEISRQKSEVRKKSKNHFHFSIKIDIQDKKGCPLYTARVIGNVSIKPSPASIRKNLGLMDSRPVNNAVDATNFVLFETGQPLHAFDLDKIKGNTIVVRRSEKGEKFLAIDGAEVTLGAGTLVIADLERVIAIAGVMGGKWTEVTAETKNILLESAYFDPVLVRQSSRAYKIFTESSHRFERGVDIESVAVASARAGKLIESLAGGTEREFAQKNFSPKVRSSQIRLRAKRVEKVLGHSVPTARAKAILGRLGFSVKTSGADVLVSSKNSRRDVTEEADLIEEILRIEGFEKVRPTTPPTRHTEKNIEDQKARRIFELKKYLAACGFYEIVTTSLLPARSITQAGLSLASASKIKNPASAEQEILRSSLLAGMLQTIAFNVHRKAASLKLFELGNCYGGEKEATRLAIALHGNWAENWRRKSKVSFYDLKGVVGNVWDHLGIESAHWPALIEGRLVKIESKVTNAFDIQGDVYYFETPLDDILADASIKKKPRVETPRKFPSVRRDLAFVVDEKVSVGSLGKLMREAGHPALREATLFDEYTGKNIPSGRRSLAFSLAYQKETGTFTESEIADLQRRVGEALKSHFGVEFR
ncbi:MAG: phenylalanine--tRNA ligase subunit beta [Candidatus Omnitrophica bacterium]|nr:phenylalanine--tRNA ligase subunit beta [Candidatus Omnitrophota bacterium]